LLAQYLRVLAPPDESSEPPHPATAAASRTAAPVAARNRRDTRVPFWDGEASGLKLRRH